nr:uncharacterized protein LOC127334927 isoform X3 [Lolium perenne]
MEDGKKQEENRCLVSCLLIKELLVVELLNASRVPYVWWHSCASPSTPDVCLLFHFLREKTFYLLASASCLCSKISALVGKCETQRTRKVEEERSFGAAGWRLLRFSHAQYPSRSGIKRFWSLQPAG